MEDNKKLIFAVRENKLGMGEVIFCWQPGNRMLAFCGENRVITIVDRLGKKIIDFPLKFGGKCKYLEFDCEGDTLGVFQDNCSIVTVINIFTKKTLDLEIDKNNKDRPTCLRWGKNNPILAIGTYKGLIYFYNKKTDKITPMSMSHSKAVISADWNEEGNLVTGDENKTLSVINRQGEALLQNAMMKAEPRLIMWARQKTSEERASFTTISTVQNNKTILIYDFKKKNNPIELALDNEYGNITTYQWFGDGYIAIGFSKGFISIVSTHMKEIKNEVHSMQLFKNGLDDLSVCEEVNRIAVAGENCVKIFDKNTWKEIVEEKIEISNQAGRISKIQWSSTGQILIVSTYLGSIFAFNVIINETFSISGNLFSTMLSLNEVCTYRIEKETKNKIYTLQLEDEPKNFVVSDQYFVASFGTIAQIFKTTDNKGKVLPKIEGIKKDFSSNISMVALNQNYMSVLAEGRCNFIKLDTDTTEKIFPLKDTDDQIYYVAMTEDFLAYSDSNNRVKIYAIKSNCANISDYKFDNPIRKIFPNKTGTKYVCIDNLGKGFLYNPINELVIPMDNESELTNIIWDQEDSNLFVGVNKGNTTIYTFYIIHNSLQGPYVRVMKEYSYIEDLDSDKVNPITTTLDKGCYPFYLSGGYLSYFIKSTKEIKGVILNSHYWLFNWRENGDSDDGHKKYFMQNYQLCRYWNCLKSAKLLNEKDQVDYFEKLGREALKNLNIDIAGESFRLAKNISLVLTVDQLKKENEKKIILGHIAAILGEEDLAQELFTESSQPEKALELRIDLQDWSIALKLAKEYCPGKEPFISRRLAYQYETQGNVQEAMKLYETSMIDNKNEFINKVDDIDVNDIDIHNQNCIAGLSRSSFRLGDTEKGLIKAQELTDKNLLIEVASLCESLSYGLESAKLYTQVGLYEKAATIYIRLKLFKSAEDLMDKIKSPKLLIQLAKMKEVEKLYADAEKAYESASDWENVIRINLKFLDNPEKAREVLLTKCKTETAALLMSDYYESKGKKKETIEYKLIAKRFDEAFAIAQSYNEMGAYGDYMLKNSKNVDEFKKIANYYEGKNDFGNSGIFYEKVGDFSKALKMFIRSKNDIFLERAVEMVGQTKDEKLINELIDYFLIESKSNQGHHFLTRLYILLGDYRQACDIAITLANDEQKFSNYKAAHQILLDLYIGLKEKNLPVSYELNHRLGVLHSYLLAKKLFKLKQHMKGARNILRVANNMTMFEEDKVKIMTIAAVECQEAGLGKSSSQWAIELMKDYKGAIPESYKARIDKISRNAYKSEEEPDMANTPCPFCKKDMPEYSLECKNCYNVVPFCIASGKHVVIGDLSKCPHCNFPAMISEMKELLVNEVKCPMCEGEVDANLMEKIEDPIAYLKGRKVAASNTNGD